MYISRRNFVKNSTFALVAASLPSHGLLAAGAVKEITGIQLYSVRDDMKKDPAGVLQQLAGMGYKYVEHANYIDRKFYGYPAKEFKRLLDGLGLLMLSGHTRLETQHWDAAKKDFTDSWKWTIEDAATMGQQYVISPWLDESYRKSYDDLKRYMEVFNKCGELCKRSGMKFGYHNHDFEFSERLNDVRVFDIILQNTDPKLVTQQLDIGNMYSAGGRPLDVLKQYPGRFELMHVKDVIKNDKVAGGYENTVLGAGIIPVKAVIDLAKKSGGTHQFIIEQEDYQGKAPLDCAKADLAVMKKWGY